MGIHKNKKNCKETTVVAAILSTALLMIACSSTRTTEIRLAGAPDTAFTGVYVAGAGEPVTVSGKLPMTIDVKGERLSWAEFKKTESGGVMELDISGGMLDKASIIATEEHTGVKASRSEDGTWTASNYR